MFFERLLALFGGKGPVGVVLAVLAFALVASWSGDGAASGGVSKVRLGGDAKATRVVVELDRAVKGRLVESATTSRQVTVALPGVQVAGALKGRGQGLVREWSVDEAAGAARLRLHLTADAVVKRRFLLPPGDGISVYRYVVDLEASGAAAASPPAPAAAATPARAAAPAPAPATRTVPARTQARAPQKRVVVIDAGHGGRDPGTRGQNAVEKDITLAAARELRDRLVKTGRYTVVMTRDSDVFVPLEQRVAIARRADADLFISLHADAGSDPSVRGASVYTLSDQGTDRAARKVMGRHDWLRDVDLPVSDPAVNRILLDLTQRATKNRSAAFARAVLENVSEHVPLLTRSHRAAGFVVLLAPDVPAVLLEMGFMTNREDERLLSDPASRRRMMNGVAQAIDQYFEAEARAYAVSDAQ